MLAAGSDLHTVRTHDNVTVGFVPARLGSRFLAALVDALVAVPLAIVVGFGVDALLSPAQDENGRLNQSLSLNFTAEAALLSGLFAYTLYFIVYEGITSGRTLGKNAAGIRVVRLDGSAPGWGEALLRGLGKSPVGLAVDLWVGPLVMFFSSLSRRIGDYVAGTVVIRERQPSASIAVAAPAVYLRSYDPGPAISGIERLGPRELTATRTLLERYDLHPVQRQRIAADLCTKLIEKLELPPDAPERRENPEPLLERVYLQLAQRLQ